MADSSVNISMLSYDKLPDFLSILNLLLLLAHSKVFYYLIDGTLNKWWIQNYDENESESRFHQPRPASLLPRDHC